MELKTQRVPAFPRPFPEKDVLFRFERLDEQGVTSQNILFLRCAVPLFENKINSNNFNVNVSCIKMRSLASRPTSNDTKQYRQNKFYVGLSNLWLLIVAPKEAFICRGRVGT